jgi:hypothetical protein
MGKWKKVMFVFILEVLHGEEGPRLESFWEVPKKCHHRPCLPKKPEVSPPEAPEASALPVTQGLDRSDAVMEDVPPPPADLSYIPLPIPPITRTKVSQDNWLVFLLLHPFPRKFDHSRIVSWVVEVDRIGATHEKQWLAATGAGHTSYIINLFFSPEDLGVLRSLGLT